MLDALGFRVLSARTASEAAVIFAEHADSIDLLLSDLLLPQVNGPEMYERLKQIKPLLRCVLMSGHQLAELEDQLYSQGIRHLIQKPFTMAAMLALIQSALDEPD